MSKLIHLKPTLWRAFTRACERHEKLGARITALGLDNAPDHLFKQLGYLQDRMYNLAGECQFIECSIDHKVNPSEVVDSLVHGDFTKNLFA